MTVTVLGSANLDLVYRVEKIPAPGETVLATGFAEHPGGKGNNQVIAVARAGASVTFVAALGTGPLPDRIAEAGPALQAHVAFVATFLYTGEIVRDGITTAKYYPWCLSWKAVTFASAPGICGGPGFGHWESAPIPGAM